MFKLLLMIVAFLLLALGVMGMRHHARELDAQAAKLQDEIEIRKHRIWDQRPQITEVTNPIALAKTMKDKGLSGDVGVAENRPKPPADDPGDLVAPVLRRH
jgi:cell division protein FtsL